MSVDEGKRRLRGTHRSCEPRETLTRIEPLRRRCGITRVANLTGLDRVGIPVVAVYRPNARSVAVSQGKGVTLEAAKASGTMEAIEVWHAERCDLPLRRASATELGATHRLCDLSRLPRATHGSDERSAARRLWVEGIDLFDHAPTWCPLEIVDADYTRRPEIDDGLLRSTNGLASGNHRLEALCHALCELIERDAVSLWRARGRRRGGLDGRVDPASVDDAVCRELLRRYAEADIDVGIWDVSGDAAVPAFFVLTLDRVTDGMLAARPANGKGCHLSKAIALSRALTEAAQTRLTYVSGARDDLDEDDYDAAAQRDNVRRCRALLDAPSSSPRDFAALHDPGVTTFENDLARLLNGLEGMGVEQAIAIDLAPATPEVAVVRVVVPGLEGPDEHPAYRPGTRALSA